MSGESKAAHLEPKRVTTSGALGSVVAMISTSRLLCSSFLVMTCFLFLGL